MKNNINLKVIEGGMLPKEKCKKSFVSAYVTDTRLMGAYGVLVQWRLEEPCEVADLFQYFYFDTEEFGFDAYESIWGMDQEKVKTLEQTAISCLGGKKIKVTEREVNYLVNYYANFNKEKGLKLPPLRQEYQFILDNPVTLDQNEIDILIGKICTPIENKYQLIHYFLMRTFGKDKTASSYLTDREELLSLYEDVPMSTFCRNSIKVNKDDPNSFICESLIDCNNQYYICTTEVETCDYTPGLREGGVNTAWKIKSATAGSKMKISSTEAAMILSKSEFVTVYKTIASPEEVSKRTLEFSYNTMIRPHENGKLFMKFNNHNDHVKHPVFLLSADVFGLYYITDHGQLIIAAYTYQDITRMEFTFATHSIEEIIQPVGRFEFKEPVLFDFVNSGFTNFFDFLAVIQDNGDDDFDQ